MKNVMIYQRPVNEELQLELNCSTPTPKSKAYFDLCMIGMGDTDAGLLVQAAIDWGFYKPTMFMTLSDPNQHAESIYRKAGRDNAVALEEIFCEGNGHGRGDYETTSLQRHSSISVGDLVVDLEDGSVTVCMPCGWQLLNKTTLALKSQYNRKEAAITIDDVIMKNRKEAAEAAAEAEGNYCTAYNPETDI